MSGKVRFSIDRGGTFTDVYAEQNLSDRSVRRTVLKLLSEDPSNYPDAPREGIRRVLESFTGKSFPRSLPLDTSEIESIRMGTTVATNALLERKGEKFLLLTTKGFRDVWHIGNQSRPDIFDLTIRCPETLYDQVAEVDERVVLLSEDAQKRFQDQALEIKQAVSGEKVLVEKHLDEKAVRETLEIARKEHGIESVAVVLMHAAIYPEHEKQVGEIARQVGFKQISLSHEVMQMVKIVPRGYTTCADAYLTPHIKRYLDTFVSGFDKQLLDRVKISFMQSDGGLTRIDRFSGHKAILSGPAGGVVGYALTTRLAADTPHGKVSEQVVGFDMGGTSTDVSRFSGHYEHVFETTTAGVTIQAPQLDISTIAAGGGSKLKYVSGILQVGPESVGAHPGPVCYRKGGELAITDANVVLGRLMPEYFPKIFGPDEKQPLDAAASLSAFRDLLTVINSESGTSTKPVNLKTPEELAYGFIRVANEAMCRPIRNLTQMRGYDLAKHTLACFGGAGGQHACAIARALGMKKVFIHRYSGILSAYGIGLADVVEDQQEPCALQVTRSGEWVQEAGKSPQMVYDTFARLQGQVVEVLQAQGFTPSEMKFEFFLNMRYNGTDTPSMARSLKKDIPLGDFVNIFEEDYRREFGFQLRDRTIVIDDIRVRGSGRSGARAAQDIEISQKTGLGQQKQEESAEPIEYRDVFFEGKWVKTPIFQLGDLMKVQGKVQGPAIILDPNSTVVVEPDCIGFVSKAGDITVDVLPKGSLSQVGSKVGAEAQFDTRTVDPIQLSLFSNRFMGIAEQMGRTLQRTSVSVNIKERLDFSCALFGPDGGLVANAPHIPVHLGAMQEAIRFQHNTFEKRKGTPEQLKEGDVLVSNHPQLAGGSHLPDITVITPCFENGEIVFWVASRGHHADVGGITPGSMPPHSKMLKDEGAAIISFKLVREGEFQEEGITKILTTKSNPENPDCEGTRTLSDNLSDLRAQVAANNHGVRLVRALVQEYNLQYVQAYMRFIQENAELAVRDMLRDFVRRKGQSTVHALDRMDDGTVIKVKISIDEKTGSADFDFAGTGPQVFGNLNAPPAVTYSAIIYSLRCLVGQDIPLNEGCLAPVTISIPRYCILNPSPESAVVGGNVLTSQRVVDVILRAFEACAASQGCMNNLTFGDHTFGYYETIAGGAGAGPTWDGRSGVHTHMTNTRITDPEIFERRYPVILREFSLRHGSGGAGEHRGGDGVVRDIEFLRPVTVSILSERRAFSPYGLLGGRDGKVGKNLLIRRGGELLESLGGKNTVPALAGDRIRLLTPGGGGFGKASMARL